MHATRGWRFRLLVASNHAKHPVSSVEPRHIGLAGGLLSPKLQWVNGIPIETSLLPGGQCGF